MGTLIPIYFKIVYAALMICLKIPRVFLLKILFMCLVFSALYCVVFYGCKQESGQFCVPEDQADALYPRDNLAAPGIILISLDTLRADRLGSYGNPDALSPTLDRVAANNVCFQNAYVQLPGTLPSHMSMLTGLYPYEHGVYPPDNRLPSRIPIAAEIFKAAGYATAGFTEGGYVRGIYGFSRGFDEFRDDLHNAKDTFSCGIGFLESLPEDQPFFLFLHTYQIHDPYKPPEPFQSIYVPQDAEKTFEPTGPNLSAVNRGTRKIQTQDVQTFKSLYNGEVRYTDSQIQHLLSAVSGSQSLRDRTMVLVTADHGEEFMEHGRMAHEQLYEELIHVPMILQVPFAKCTGIVTQLVESVDLLPGFLSFAGMPAQKNLSGQSIFTPILNGAAKVSSAFSEGFIDKAFTLLIKQPKSMKKLLIKRVDRSLQSRTALEKTAVIKVIGPEVCLRLKAYSEQRKVRILHEGKEVDTITVPRWWKTFDFSIPGTGITELSLESETCTVPADVSDSRDIRCISLFARETDTAILSDRELYDLNVDPAEKNAIGSFSENGLDHESCLKYLLHEQEPHAQSERIILDSDTESELKALGYLN